MWRFALTKIFLIRLAGADPGFLRVGWLIEIISKIFFTDYSQVSVLLIMGYGSTPYVGMAPKVNGGHIKSAQMTCTFLSFKFVHFGVQMSIILK